MTKLSHSSKNTYKECSEKYRLKYVERYRTTDLSSSLFFGGALDRAINELLLKHSGKPHKDAKMAFLEAFTMVRSADDTTIDIRQYEGARYFKSDFDSALLKGEDLQGIQGVTDIPKFMDYCRTNTIDINDTKLFNYLNWCSLKEKGLLLLQAYEDQILPQIDMVISIQEEVNLPNVDGDEVIGFIDLICTFKDDPGTVYICDNKTSSSSYTMDNLLTSEQLATYGYAKNIPHAAYIVLDKRLRKKQPIVKTQIIKGVISVDLFDKTIDEFDKTLYNINNQVYDKIDKNKCFSFGRRCEYYDYCWNNSLKNLIKKEEK